MLLKSLVAALVLSSVSYVQADHSCQIRQGTALTAAGATMASGYAGVRSLYLARTQWQQLLTDTVWSHRHITVGAMRGYVMAVPHEFGTRTVSVQYSDSPALLRATRELAEIDQRLDAVLYRTGGDYRRSGSTIIYGRGFTGPRQYVDASLHRIGLLDEYLALEARFRDLGNKIRNMKEVGIKTMVVPNGNVRAAVRELESQNKSVYRVSIFDQVKASRVRGYLRNGYLAVGVAVGLGLISLEELASAKIACARENEINR